jgi:hypothetical protein
MYQMPSGHDQIPQHQWASELKEKLHDAHNAVREHIRGKMHREKRYHDAKLN